MMKLDSILMTVPVNSSRRMDCPYCGGTNTFSVTNTNGKVLYNCFRNDCIEGGAIEQHLDKDDIRAIFNTREEPKEFKLEPYIKEGLDNKAVFNHIHKTNGLNSYLRGQYKVAYDPTQERMLYLLRENNKIVGAVGRALYTYRQYPKVLLYKDSKIMPFIVGNTKKAVIVEDCASATSVNSSEEYTGVALLGTILKAEYIPYLKQFDEIYIALDLDARRKAIDVRNSLRYIKYNVDIWNITKDFKDMSKEEVKEFVETESSSL